jgi:DNA adenine methylase
MSPMLNRAQRLIINEMPPHNLFLELFIGKKPIMRLKRRASINIGLDSDPDVVAAAAERYRDCGFTLICEDAIAFLGRNEWLHPQGKELVYCALPQLGSNHRRESTQTYQSFLLEVLRELPGMVIIAGAWHELYQHQLADWRTISYKGAGGVDKFAWLNFDQPLQLHDYRYLENHYELERRAARWRERLADMPLLERQALLYTLQSLKK